MAWKIFILILVIWCEIYTLSYGIFELRNKNTPGAAGVFALCAILAVASGGIIVGI